MVRYISFFLIILSLAFTCPALAEDEGHDGSGNDEIGDVNIVIPDTPGNDGDSVNYDTGGNSTPKYEDNEESDTFIVYIRGRDNLIPVKISIPGSNADLTHYEKEYTAPVTVNDSEDNVEGNTDDIEVEPLETRRNITRPNIGKNWGPKDDSMESDVELKPETLIDDTYDKLEGEGFLTCGGGEVQPGTKSGYLCCPQDEEICLEIGLPPCN